MSFEKERMLNGGLYNPLDEHLAGERRRARDLLFELNHSREDEEEKRRRVVRELFGAVGENVWLEPPFYCDYGTNIRLGAQVFFNFNCVVLDPAPVTIGDNTLFGPGVQIYTPPHPLDPVERRKGLELARPVTIDADVWVGGGAVICPGVKVGARTVIGAGSVVVKDLPADVLAAGNPCRVIRALNAGAAAC